MSTTFICLFILVAAMMICASLTDVCKAIDRASKVK